MKVCFVTNIYPPDFAGGPGEVVYNLQNFFLEQGIEAHVFTCGAKDRQYPNTIRTVGGKRLFPIISPFYFGKIKENKFDIINFHSESGMGIAPLSLIDRSFKVITTLHSEVLAESQSTKAVRIEGSTTEALSGDELLAKYLLASIKVVGIYMDVVVSKRIIAVSQKTKLDFVRQGKINPEKISVIHNGVDSNIFSPEISGERIRENFKIKNSPVILTVSGNILLKGTVFALLALQQVNKINQNAKLIVVGVNSKNRERLSVIIKRLDLEKSVIVTGKVPNKEMPFYYSAADVVLLPSLSENFPIVALEAMSSGKPVIASKVGGLPEMIDNNVNGILVDPGKVDQIVDALLRIFQSPSMQKNMGQNGRRIVKEKFDWAQIGKEYLELFESVV